MNTANLVEIFCLLDNFCQKFNPELEKARQLETKLCFLFPAALALHYLCTRIGTLLKA